MSDYLALLARSAKGVEPVFKGDWATIFFRPDLGSQQEFIIGVAAAIEGDAKPYIKWLPSFAKLGSLYGDAISNNDTRTLIAGSEQAISNSFVCHLSNLDSGTPHIRIVPCGYIATNDIENELNRRLKRHAAVLWTELNHRDSLMDDDWAYSEMRKFIASLDGTIFLPHRKFSIDAKSFDVELDNGNSFGNILSARYASAATVERHISTALRQVLGAHRLAKRDAPPALFVILPDAGSQNEVLIIQKTSRLLEEIEDAGVSSFSDTNPQSLAKKLEKWAVKRAF